MASVLCLAEIYSRSVHIAHVARRDEILLIRAAKAKGLPVTCEVTPHHLFLHRNNTQFILDAYGMHPGYCHVKPELQTVEDCQALWDNLDVIDCIATDHAPHTRDEKSKKENPPPGFAGLQTVLPLMLTAVNDGKLTIEQLIEKMYTNPKRIFNLPDQGNDTFIEVDMDRKWIIDDRSLLSKAGWTPFIGMQMRGAVHRVVLRGEVVFVDGQVLAQQGTGKNLASMRSDKKQVKRIKTPQTLPTEVKHSPSHAPQTRQRCEFSFFRSFGEETRMFCDSYQRTKRLGEAGGHPESSNWFGKTSPAQCAAVEPCSGKSLGHLESVV